MQYVIMDLEWNGVFCKSVGGYFNEIIDLGAIRLNNDMQPVDEFSQLIRPQVSVKLSDIVKKLTGISSEQLSEGMDIFETFDHFTQWVGEEETVFLTWSTSDLLVLLENFRYFYREDTIPFLTNYADLQAFSQHGLALQSGNHLGLQNAGSLLQLEMDGELLHRALGDSRLSARIFQKQFDKKLFSGFIKDATKQEFYDRLTFKNTIISDFHHAELNRKDFFFLCPLCGGKIKRLEEWSFRRRRFCTDYHCSHCDKTFEAFVQVKLKYEGTSVKRGIFEKPEPSEEASLSKPQEKVPSAVSGPKQKTIKRKTLSIKQKQAEESPISS